MAILRGGRGRIGLEVEVLVDSNPAKEFDEKNDEETPERTVTKYIEAVTDAKFEIRYELTNHRYTRHGVLFELHIDGQKVESCIHRNSRIGRELVTICKGARVRSNRTFVLREFHFSELATDKTRPHLQDPGVLEQIGTISVKFYLIKRIGKSGRSSRRSTTGTTTLTERQQIPESDLKGQSLSHFGGFGPALPTGKFGSLGVRYVDSERKPFGTFNFYYRSLASLKALEIVPRSPSPVPPPSGPRPYQNMTQAELVEIVRTQEKQLEAIRAAMGQTVITVPKIEPRANPTPKREMVNEDELSLLSVERAKGRRQVPGESHEVIELD
ncbi:hypothetical protein BU24DRAFT_494099 [Aaosphaeria arxii CBS 175.79]|uniref:DUF7918 domain-containing protein n=1 Tax=Aaosphaeria arxii CBS 175.79 TaxID=1450172 RepID=A0A6A5XL98_9PLEO|nr:uncharacterized protein BU24DRAFT_494099 [Aaosphaeria arxii CBS 175.79]KAF2013666.1 hypothetical protein BU24DRAFT_494099 [Aaosphaeria arxii CBS 175.79]